MYYIGVDLHKEQSWFYIMDEEGDKVDSRSIPNDTFLLKEYFKLILEPFTLTVESTYNWYFFVDIAEMYAEKVYLANSYELKAFAKRHKKTDKIDARLIADVLRKGYLPAVTIPDKDTRNMKELLRYRMNMVKDRSRSIFRLKATLDKLGDMSWGNFTTYKRLDQINLSNYSLNYQRIITGYIENIKYLNKKIYEADKFIEAKAIEDIDIKNLTSIPGINYFSAMLIKTEIIDVQRFSSFNRLCAYAGLAPRVSQSANKTIHGPLNVNRRKHLQWILLENVYHFIKALPEKTQRYSIIAKRKGHNSAKVALARELLKIIYHLLKEKRVFYKNKDRSYKIRSTVAPALSGA